MSIEYFAKKISIREGEEIIAILHHHPITYIKQILITGFLVLLSFFLMFYLFSSGYLGVAVFCALLFTSVFYGLRELYIWFSNIFVITNQRIIDIDQKGFFNKTVSEVPYDKILDICYTVKGFWQTILKLGSVKIQATGASLLLSNIKDIVKVNQLLTDLVKEQTGKVIEIKKVKQFNSTEKEKLTEEFLNQDELAEYEEFNLAELIEEYKEVFGELSLKKILVDELEEYDEEIDEEGDYDDEQEDKQEDEEAIEETIEDDLPVKGGNINKKHKKTSKKSNSEIAAKKFKKRKL